MISPEDRKSVVVGYKQVLKALQSGICEKIFVAVDCPSSMQDSVMAAAGNVPIESVPSMRELGKECGIDVHASCAAKIHS